MARVPAPLFRDPLYNSPADPMIIRNEQNGKFYLFYTQRRASASFAKNVAYCYGTQIGVAEAAEDGSYWFYRGALDLNFEFGLNTFWAPEIIWDPNSQLYHMYVSYIQGLHSEWKGKAYIIHYTSPDLFHWEYVGPLTFAGDRVIDPCLYRLENGTYRMWYKGESNGSHTFYADSKDLYHWEYKGPATNDYRQEGPNVFAFGGKYWMIADEWDGLGIYVSDDLTTFTRQEGERILSGNGTREQDQGVGRHADVLVYGDKAYIVYFVHYNDNGEAEDPEHHEPSVVQLAELEIIDGKLCCDRNKEFDISLK